MFKGCKQGFDNDDYLNWNAIGPHDGAQPWKIKENVFQIETNNWVETRDVKV